LSQQQPEEPHPLVIKNTISDLTTAMNGQIAQLYKQVMQANGAIQQKDRVITELQTQLAKFKPKNTSTDTAEGKAKFVVKPKKKKK